MYWIDDAWILIVIFAVFWFAGLVVCIGVPIAVVKIFHIKANLWSVAFHSALFWILGTWLWFVRPM